MKYLMAIYLLLSLIPINAQTDCGARLNQLIKTADDHFNNGYFRQAYEEYRAARGCQSADLVYIEKQMVAAMEGIDNQRAQAEQNERAAVIARAAAEKSKREAIAAKEGLQSALLQAKRAENDAIMARNEALAAEKTADSLAAINLKQFETLRDANDKKINELLRNADQSLRKLEYDSAFLTCQAIYALPEGDKKGERLLYELIYFFSESGQFGKASDAMILAGKNGVSANRSSITALLKNWNEGLFSELMLRYYPELVAVKGGTFLMGADPGRDADLLDDAPLHYETVGDFSIGKTEVTKRQFLVFAVGSAREGTTLSGTFTGKWADDPVDSIRWPDAIAYVNWLSIQMGKEPVYELEHVVALTEKRGRDTISQISLNRNLYGYRLPTEVEWEYAARGGPFLEQSRYPGSDRPEKVAWESNKTNKLHPVASLKPNALGLYDMSGNVSEWCEDVYVIKTTATNITQKYRYNLDHYLFRNQLRINRGSSYKERNRVGELAKRDYLYINLKREVGFRVVLTEPGFSVQNK